MTDKKNKTDLPDTTNWTFDDWYQNFREAGLSHGRATVSANMAVGNKPKCEPGETCDYT